MKIISLSSLRVDTPTVCALDTTMHCCNVLYSSTARD
jgi:hypothetical protein